MRRLNNHLKRAIACAGLSTVLLTAAAQEIYDGFGLYNYQELEMKECTFDKSADAVVLLDQGNSFFNEQFQLITERRVRLKILKEKGIARGDVQIPYYSAEGFEFLTEIEAVVITPNPGGTPIITTLEKKNIFERKINRLYSLVSFALPNVKVGSIIDYRYKSQMKSYAGLKRWEFQKEIPVLKSAYELAPIPNSEFAYSVYKLPNLPVDIQPNKSAGRVRFTMQNIPGLRDEVFMTTTQDYLQRVNFQFASYSDYYGKRTYTSNWKELTNELLSEREFGSQANKNMADAAIIKNLLPSLSPIQKMSSIFDYVRGNITWDNIGSKYSSEGVKNTLEKKKGNAGEINLLLVSLLKSAGLETYPLLVSERDHGKVDTTYSYLDQFNKVVAYVLVDGKSYTLDGTDMHTPFFMVPPDLLNTTAYIVDKKKGGFVYFKNLNHRQKEYIGLSGTVTEDGTFEGKALISESEYSKLAKTTNFKTQESRYLEALTKPHTFLKVDSFSLSGLKTDSAALSEEVLFRYNLKNSGGYYQLNYNIFTGLHENPFVTQYRFTEIDFGSQSSTVLTGGFTLPAKLANVTLPKNQRIMSADRTLSASRIVEKNDNIVSIKVTFDINRENYAPEEYQDVRDFFKLVVDMLNEPILLKAN